MFPEKHNAERTKQGEQVEVNELRKERNSIKLKQEIKPRASKSFTDIDI